jgi:hypothetical protein
MQDGMNFNEILKGDLIVGSCPQDAKDVDRCERTHACVGAMSLLICTS